MPRKNIRHMISGLPFEGKLVFFGSVILLISAFMPWYEDVDAFHMGDMFLGITGPLYLAGFVLILISGLALFAISSDALDQKLKELPLEKPHMNMMIGIASLFLLVLSSSVYFHTKFGVNITIKEMKFGMIAAFIGAFFIAFGGFMQNKKKNVRFDELEGKIEPLINIRPEREQGEIRRPDQEPEQEEVRPEDRQIHL
ncbi:MAG: hypothetical protein ABH856_04035 [Patescibacteria group bacterium]|nr:hypothetical protein [Patescibacteria group bacterium]